MRGVQLPALKKTVQARLGRRNQTNYPNRLRVAGYSSQLAWQKVIRRPRPADGYLAVFQLAGGAAVAVLVFFYVLGVNQVGDVDQAGGAPFLKLEASHWGCPTLFRVLCEKGRARLNDISQTPKLFRALRGKRGFGSARAFRRAVKAGTAQGRRP